MDAEFLEQLKQMAELEITPGNQARVSACVDRELLDEDAESYHMPAYLKEQLIDRVHQPDVQPISAKRKRSKRVELFLYSCKVSAAVAASLVIIFSVSATQSTISELADANTSISTQWGENGWQTTDDIPEVSNDVTDRNIEESNQPATDTEDTSAEDTTDNTNQNTISKKINKGSQSITNWLQDFSGQFFQLNIYQEYRK